MKYSQQIGVLAALLLIVSCFLPWIYIDALNKTLNGVNGYISNTITFGTQIKPHSFFCIIAIILFSVNKIWAKRTNIFICFLSLSWAIKNYILFTICRPECPTIKSGLYLLLFFAVIMQVMSFLPTIKIENKN